MNAKIALFVICAKAIIHLLLHNLHECILNYYKHPEVITLKCSLMLKSPF